MVFEPKGENDDTRRAYTLAEISQDLLEALLASNSDLTTPDDALNDS